MLLKGKGYTPTENWNSPKDLNDNTKPLILWLAWGGNNSKYQLWKLFPLAPKSPAKSGPKH